MLNIEKANKITQEIYNEMVQYLQLELGSGIVVNNTFLVEDKYDTGAIIKDSNDIVLENLTKANMMLERSITDGTVYTKVAVYTKLNMYTALMNENLFKRNIIRAIAHEFRHVWQVRTGMIELDKYYRNEYSYQNRKQYNNLPTEKDAVKFEKHFFNKYGKTIMKELNI